jgi:hypothetical protein
MLTQLTSGLGSKLADQWVAVLLTPAFVFWVGGLLAWSWHFGWGSLETWFTTQPATIQIVILVLALLVVSTSAWAVQSFDLAVLRFLEGYWPEWMRPLRSRLRQRMETRFKQSDQQFQKLSIKGLAHLSPEELDRYVKLDRSLMYIPSTPDRLMPTALGNVLRAAELHPKDKYGLDAVICWPHLWLIMPDGAKQEISGARSTLNAGAHLWLWSILFLVWTIWAWWAFPLGLIGAFFAYRWMLYSAMMYSDLIGAAFDLHRFTLYISLHWPLPENPAAERPMGEQLTDYLWRGSDASSPIFTKPKE